MTRELRARVGEFPLLLALVALAAAGQTALVHSRELWLDETHTALVTSMPLRSLMEFVRGDVHPPLYFVAMAGWRRLFGGSELGMRSLSMLSGALTAIVGFYTAVTLWPRRYAWLATLLILCSPVLFYYAGEARGYSLGTLWMAATFACVVASERTTTYRAPALIGAAVFGAAAYYTHYVALFAIVALFGCWALHAFRRKTSLPGVVMACVLTAAMIIPWAPVMLQQRAVRIAQDTNQERARQDSASLTFGTPPLNQQSRPQRARAIGEEVAGIAGAYAGLLHDRPNPLKRTFVVVLLAMPLLIAIVLGVVAATRENWIAGACAAVVVANVVGMAALGLEGRRYLIFCVPCLIFLMVFGVVELERSKFGWRAAGLLAGAVLLLNLAGAVRVLHDSASQALHGLTSIVAKAAAAGDIIVFSSAFAQVPFDYYAYPLGLKAREDGFPVTIRAWWADQPFKGWGGPVPTHAQLREFATRERQRAAGGALWLVLFENNVYDPGNALRSALVDRARSVTDVGACGQAPASACGLSEWHVYRIQY